MLMFQVLTKSCSEQGATQRGFQEILIREQLKGQTLTRGFPLRVPTFQPITLQEMPRFQSDKQGWTLVIKLGTKCFRHLPLK